MKYIILLTVILGLAFLNVLSTEKLGVYKKDLEYKEKEIGKMEVSIFPDSLFKPRMQSEVLVKFDNLPGFVDSTMKALGNMNSCSKRVLWAGKTTVKDTGKVLKLSSRVRYEQWSCILTEIFIFQDTKTVLWHLSLDWQKNPEIIAKVDNVKNFPNWLEKLLSIRQEKTLQIKLPKQCGSCDCTDTFKPKLENSVFSRNGKEVVLKASVSFKKLSIFKAAKCFLPAS